MENERLNDLLAISYRLGSRSLIDVLRGKLPDCAGVYLVIHPEYGIVYIGKTKSLKKRCKNRGWFLSSIHVVWVRMEVEDQDMVEQFLIRLYKPAWNIKHNRTRKVA